MMIKVFSATDKTYTSNGDVVIAELSVMQERLVILRMRIYSRI